MRLTKDELPEHPKNNRWIAEPGLKTLAFQFLPEGVAVETRDPFLNSMFDIRE
jgi:hypothetical protein